MAANCIGIEIGSSTLKLAQIKNGQLLSMASVRLPEGLMRHGRVTDPAAMAAMLRNSVKEHGIRGRKCALVLPPQSVLSQYLTLPIMDKSKPEEELPLAFRDYVDRDAGEYDYDYIVTGLHDGLLELYATAVPRSLVEEFWSICKQAGLTLQLAIPGELAWLNLIAQKSNLPDKLAILDLGSSAARIHIFANGNFIMGKELSFAGQTLAAEVRRAVNFYNYSLPSGEPPLEDLYYCGGNSLAEPLRAAIAESAELNLHPIGRLLEADFGDASQICAIAAGAAVPCIQEGFHRERTGTPSAKRTMNFVRHKASFDLRRVLPAVLAAIIALLLFVNVGFLDPLQQKARAYDALSQKQELLAQINTRLVGFDELQQEYLRYGTSLMQEAEASLVSRTDVLDLVETKIAGRAAIENLAVNNNILTINISGITLEEASAIVSSLETSELVTSAAIHSATAEDGKQARILISVTLEEG